MMFVVKKKVSLVYFRYIIVEVNIVREKKNRVSLYLLLVKIVFQVFVKVILVRKKTCFRIFRVR